MLKVDPNVNISRKIALNIAAETCYANKIQTRPVDSLLQSVNGPCVETLSYQSLPRVNVPQL